MAFSSQKHTTLDLLFLVPLALFFLLFKLGVGSLASWDEAIYASLASEMVRSGQWLRMTFNGIPFLDKPPLAVWFTALFYQLFGVQEFSARLFSALCGVGCVVMTYFLGRTLLNRWTGLLGALILLSSSHFIRYTRFGMLDAPVTLFMTFALYFFWLGQNRNRYLIFSGIAIGLAVMTKGFSALAVFPIIWLYAWLSGRLDVLNRSSYWVGVMIAVALALPWHLYTLFSYANAIPSHGWALPRDLFGGNVFFYLRVLVNKYHPWILVGIFSAPYLLYRAFRERENEIIFLTVWMFFIFIAISILKEKESVCLLPVYPALSLSVAYVLSRLFREDYAPGVRVVFVLLMALHIPYSNIFEHDYSRQIKGISQTLRSVVPEDRPVALYNYHETPAVAFYTGRASYYLDTPEILKNRLQERDMYLLIRDGDLSVLGGAAFLNSSGMRWRARHENLNLVVKKS